MSILRLSFLADGHWRSGVPSGYCECGRLIMIQVCPTDIVHASPDRIWDLLTNPRRLAGWSETTLIEAPEREITSGDRLVLGAGLAHRFRVVFHVRQTVRPRLLSIDIRLPFGVTNDETIEISPVGSGLCRVTFN